MIRLMSPGVLLAASILCAACGGGGGGGSSSYTVTYNGNGATGGAVPLDSGRYTQGQTVTVLGNTGSLVDAGHVFSGWSTAANGSGAHYVQGQTFTMGSASVTLYAQWTSGGGLAVTYDANGSTGGAVPSDPGSYSSGQTVTVLGNTGSLVFSGYKFVGWQTKADGSGTTYAAGSTFSMGAASVTLYALWAGGYAYAANHQNGAGGSVSQYTIGPNGALTPMSTPSVSTGGNDPRYLSVDPSGKYMYVSNARGSDPIGDYGFLSQFTINADGSLTPMSTPTFYPAGPFPQGGAVHPSGKWYYVTIAGGDSPWNIVSQNTIGTNGMLSAMSPPTVISGSGGHNSNQAVAIDPSGKYAYVVNGGAATVSQYNIDQTTGALSAMSTPTVATGGEAWEIKIVSIPAGNYAYVSNYGNITSHGTIAQYRIDPATGMLSPLTPPTVSVGDEYALSIAVHPTGKFAYVPIGYTSPSAVIAQFKIDQATGALVSNGAASAGGAGTAWIAIESSGKYAYATSGDSGWGSTSIAQFTIDQATGALTLMANPTVQAAFGPSEIVTVGK
jgi:uncharacterized repeat protein (TIGR02543 family)